jgi:calcium-dependent protein kinase
MDYKKRKTSVALLEHPFIAYSNNLHNSFGTPSISEKGARILSRQLSTNLSSGGLRRTSMAAVAFQMPPQKATLLRNLFQEIDKDGLGTVDFEEFKAAMKAVDPTLSQGDIKSLFDAMDLDGDGEVSFIEFVAATIDPREVDYQEMNQAFRLLDADGKGYITREDLHRVLDTSNKDDLVVQAAASNITLKARSNSFGSDGGELVLLGSHDRQEKRMKKLNARIAQIVEKADINKDGMIR